MFHPRPTTDQFTVEYQDPDEQLHEYYHMTGQGYQIDLMPCPEGFDVELYDPNGKLLLKPLCTKLNINSPTVNSLTLWRKIIKNCYILLDEWENGKRGMDA